VSDRNAQVGIQSELYPPAVLSDQISRATGPFCRHSRQELMVGNNDVALPVPERNIDAARVAVLMCTKNGAAFLGEQLQSIADQTHQNWFLIVSDDGSTDETQAILGAFIKAHPLKTAVRSGPGKGVRENFLSLATDPAIDADFFAFSDQDDVWQRDKLRRALTWLVTVPDDVPALYCGRTELMSTDGRSYGFSPRFTRPPSFQNALVQNLGGGNTMVFNRAVKKILEAAATFEAVLHDWWLYQLVSAVGGQVHYDPQPTLKYRQHQANLIGSNLGWRPRLARLKMLLDGRFRDWNSANIAALRRVPAHLMPARNREVLELFDQARFGSLSKRFTCLKQSGVYRQTAFGNLALLAAVILKRI
jgi:Glycosyl transferase family 2